MAESIEAGKAKLAEQARQLDLKHQQAREQHRLEISAEWAALFEEMRPSLPAWVHPLLIPLEESWSYHSARYPLVLPIGPMFIAWRHNPGEWIFYDGSLDATRYTDFEMALAALQSDYDARIARQRVIAQKNEEWNQEQKRRKEDAAIANVIAGAPQADQRPQWQIDEEERMIAESLGEQPRQRQPDPLDRIAAALEAQNAILARLSDAVEDIAAVAVGAEAGLRTLIAQLDGLGSFSVWGEDDDADADPLEIPL